MKEFIELFSALLIPVIAVATTFIAIFQYRTERQRWRLDMFEKRYPIYEHTMKYIASIIREANAKDPELFSFSRDTKDAELLFGPEIKNYLRELYVKGVDLRTHHAIMEPLPVGEERSKHAKEIRDLCLYFGDQFEKTKSLFGEYIRIHEK